MATNGLSTTYGKQEGEGWFKFDIAATASTVGMVLPDSFNEECFIEAVIKQGTATHSFMIYNPGGTTIPVRIVPHPNVALASYVAAGANVPMLVPELSTGTINTNHTTFLVKNATTGKCDIRQTAGTGTANTVWVRRIG